MPTRNDIAQTVFDAIDAYNEQWAEGEPLEKSQDTVLFGAGGRLDSLGLINFMVVAEEKIEDTFDTPVALADENAMSAERSPFRTVNTLIDHVCLLLDGVHSE